MVSGTMRVEESTFITGRDAVNAQRGTEVWGANYVFSPSGLQYDIGTIAEITKDITAGGSFSDITFAASGTAEVGSASAPIAVSGIYMNGDGGVVYRLVIDEASGLVSGVAV